MVEQMQGCGGAVWIWCGGGNDAKWSSTWNILQECRVGEDDVPRGTSQIQSEVFFQLVPMSSLKLEMDVPT